ncbi:hypothetical protein TREMEDRAFT_59881 [Tremella mesenterica DSM 1558]|uniref:uncharacterized protein n=1 Tax=Tremella mesenterica (strain ATCC 24925 / CBS 8224 / DSM 1558 / NBRC 9311 / NRRL Y-6157 / RJB 2259-6 / UBC 559-6) TaxID=578456 RepID=UPI0003F493B7|nr:uncharacterized protein TREMEDRAFT_59881 [Tremella mesenterica DSM 1558]EIW73708.1 hypothetical protein TREMEDRAFT_59881 [Tremella mesenterica DSM 1558]
MGVLSRTSPAYPSVLAKLHNTTVAEATLADTDSHQRYIANSDSLDRDARNSDPSLHPSAVSLSASQRTPLVNGPQSPTHSSSPTQGTDSDSDDSAKAEPPSNKAPKTEEQESLGNNELSKGSRVEEKSDMGDAQSTEPSTQAAVIVTSITILTYACEM